MTDDYDIEREEAQFEHDMEQLDRIAELEETVEQLEARIGELARENAELRQVPRHVDDSPRCPLRDSMTGEMGECRSDCMWLLKSVNGCGYCAIPVWAARQENLPIEECMKFNYTRLEKS